MSEPIKVGDLVQVVRCCCIGYLDGVSTFIVADIHPRVKYATRCSACYAHLPSDSYASDVPGIPGAPLSWLKRIPPLSELGDVRHDEEITA
jgi:hypothetical protein